MSEVAAKLKRVRELLSEEGLAAVRLRGVDWFSWITGGGSSVVIFTTEVGVAEVLVTRTHAFVLTTPIESPRLSEEELTTEFETVTVPWSKPSHLSSLVSELSGGGRIASDRPQGEERALSEQFVQLKLQLGEDELERYRLLGREASEAMSESLLASSPDWTERQLAGEGARQLWTRGIHPTLVMVAGVERLEKHRHPFPTDRRIGRRAMMVFCARRHGLYANLTRFIAFSPQTREERERMQLVAQLEDVAFRCSTPNRQLSEVYEELVTAYDRLGVAEQALAQHFGGLTGYLSREAFARPRTESEGRIKIPDGSALAWNPTLPGAKIEDTVLSSSLGIEILTVDARWPTVEISGRQRPAVMEM